MVLHSVFFLIYLLRKRNILWIEHTRACGVYFQKRYYIAQPPVMYPIPAPGSQRDDYCTSACRWMRDFARYKQRALFIHKAMNAPHTASVDVSCVLCCCCCCAYDDGAGCCHTCDVHLWIARRERMKTKLLEDCSFHCVFESEYMRITVKWLNLRTVRAHGHRFAKEIAFRLMFIGGGGRHCAVSFVSLPVWVCK